VKFHEISQSSMYSARRRIFTSEAAYTEDYDILSLFGPNSKGTPLRKYTKSKDFRNPQYTLPRRRQNHLRAASYIKTVQKSVKFHEISQSSMYSARRRIFASEAAYTEDYDILSLFGPNSKGGALTKTRKLKRFSQSSIYSASEATKPSPGSFV